jgi:hypothetical protein
MYQRRPKPGMFETPVICGRFWPEGLCLPIVLIACGGRGDVDAARGQPDDASRPSITEAPVVVFDWLRNAFQTAPGDWSPILAPIEPTPAALSCLDEATIADAQYRLVPGGATAMICVAADTMSGVRIAGSDCRPVGCAATEECPGGFQCSQGYCTWPDGKLNDIDVSALCMGDVSWPLDCDDLRSTPGFSRLAQVSATCDADGCSSLPADCEDIYR